MRKYRNFILKNFSDNDFLGRIFPFYHQFYHNGTLEYYDNKEFDILETDKFFVLVTSKGGSSIMQNIINLLNGKSRDDNSFFKLSEFFRDNQNFLTVGSTELVTQNGNEEFIKLLNGKSNKDLIIITRNPLFKWLSGIIQDVEGELRDSESELYKWVDDTFKGFDISNINKSPDSRDYDLNQPIISKIIYKYLMLMYLDNNNSCTKNHASLYNELFYLFLENNKNINFSKVRLVDIDSENGDIVEFIKNYYPSLDDSNFSEFYTRRNTWQFYFETITDEFKDDISVIESISNDIRRDLYFYLLLKNKFEKELL